MATENEVQPEARPPKPAAPAQPDPELARLRAEAAEAAGLRAQMNQVAEMVQSGKLVLKQEEAPKHVEPEDDTALIDRREMKKAIEELKTSAANVIVETATQSARQMRFLSKDSLRSKLKNFEKYETEMDAILDKIPDPRVAADPATIKQVHKLVRAQHIDEEVEETLTERRSQWESDLRSKGWEPDEIEEEVEARAEALREEADEDVPAREGARQARPAARPSGVAPSGNASGARLASSRRSAAAPPLTREQRAMATQFGISSAEEWHRYADPNYRHDSLGFKGRKRI